MGSFNLFSRFARCPASTTKQSLARCSQFSLSKNAIARPLVHRFSPQWSQSRSIMIESEEAVLRDSLALLSEVEKWGWVIYRCTYTDDALWVKFRDLVEAESRQNIAESDAPDLVERMEWTWVEDASTLDEVSTTALRDRFRAWVTDEVARQPGNYSLSSVPRFSYFIKVDQEALESLVEPLSREIPSLTDGFVKFVDASWEPLGEQKDETEDDWEEDSFESIEGCTEEDVGWMCIWPLALNPHFYMLMSCSLDPIWHLTYRRPPRIVRY